MNCDWFLRHIARLPVRKVSLTIVTEMQRHAANCVTCGLEWGRARIFREMLLAAKDDEPDTSVVQRACAGLDRVEVEHEAIRFGRFKTPIGVVFVGVTDKGVCDVTFGQPSERLYRAGLLRRSSKVWRDDAGLTNVGEELKAYFSGELVRFSLSVDLSQVKPFTVRVLKETCRIQFGDVKSYGEIATRVGLPNGGRAVGGALGRNPVPIIIPCHRVIEKGGRLGGFTGGLSTKRILLTLEGHCFTESS